jgi:hypothetical protein
MILIMGVRAYMKALATLMLACRNGHVASHQLLKVTQKFTLFFVPLFPVRTRYYTVCAQCGLWVPWNREEAVAASSSAGARGVSVAGRDAGAGFRPGSGSSSGRGAGGGAAGGGAGGAGGGGGSGRALPADPVAPPLRPVTSLHLAPPTAGPGWYPDPAGDSQFRYWDGAVWTEAVYGCPPT